MPRDRDYEQQIYMRALRKAEAEQRTAEIDTECAELRLAITKLNTRAEAERVRRTLGGMLAAQCDDLLLMVTRTKP